MLENIQFINYKCFEDATIPLKNITIAVGKNNAGKSTMIEGLRLISLAIKYGSKNGYKDLPSFFQQRRKKSKKLNLDSLKIDLRTISHFYKEDSISTIIGYFDNKNKIEIYISDNMAYACYYDKLGKNIKNASNFLLNHFPKVEILPQIGLIKEEEKQLADSTIANGRDTYLSSRHFRNEILSEKRRDITVYEQFCHLAEQTWPGLKVMELNAPSISFNSDETPPIQLMIEADRFPSEIGYMGSGTNVASDYLVYL